MRYRQAIKINPHFAAVHNNLGVTLNEFRHDEAIRSFQQAIKLSLTTPKPTTIWPTC